MKTDTPPTSDAIVNLDVLRDFVSGRYDSESPARLNAHRQIAIEMIDWLSAREIAAQPGEGGEMAEVLGEAYQVVGSLLSDVGAFDTDEAVKILDNLSQQRMVHRDVLPWPSFAPPHVADALDGERVKWAEALIRQMPRDHDGRNSWLINHGVSEEADWYRAEHTRYGNAWKGWRQDYPQPQRRTYEPAIAARAEAGGNDHG